MEDFLDPEQIAERLTKQWHFHRGKMLDTEIMMRRNKVPIPSEMDVSSMTIEDACHHILKIKRCPLLVQTIEASLSAFRRDVSTENSLRTILSRSPVFKRFGKNLYGLSEWGDLVEPYQPPLNDDIEGAG